MSEYTCHPTIANLLYWPLIFRFVTFFKPYFSVPDASDMKFSLNGTTYPNNSLVTLEDIGEIDNALLCMTNLSACCRAPYGSAQGNWFLPNTTRVPSKNIWDFYRTRGQMVVYMRRIGGGENGIYRCEIHDSMNVKQNIYIGVYTAGTGE